MGESVLLCRLDKRGIDVEDASLNYVIHRCAWVLLSDLARIVRSNALDAKRNQLLRSQVREARALHPGNKLRCDPKDTKRDRILETLDLKTLLLEAADVLGCDALYLARDEFVG